MLFNEGIARGLVIYKDMALSWFCFSCFFVSGWVRNFVNMCNAWVQVKYANLLGTRKYLMFPNFVKFST